MKTHEEVSRLLRELEPGDEFLIRTAYHDDQCPCVDPSMATIHCTCSPTFIVREYDGTRWVEVKE